MADHFYGVNVGDKFETSNVVVGTATSGLEIELRIEDGVDDNSKHEVIKALELIMAKIVEGDAPA